MRARRSAHGGALLLAAALAASPAGAAALEQVTQAEWMVYLARVGRFEDELPAHATSDVIAAHLSLAPGGQGTAAGAPCRAALLPPSGWSDLDRVSGDVAAWTLFHALGLHAHLPRTAEVRQFAPRELELDGARGVPVATREEEPGTHGRVAPQVRSLLFPAGGRATLVLDVPQEGSHGVQLLGEHLDGTTFAYDACRYRAACGQPGLAFALPIAPGRHRLAIELPRGAIVESIRLFRLDDSLPAMQAALATRGVTIDRSTVALTRSAALELVRTASAACGTP